MPVPIKYFDVNWVNGMKINKDHFVQLENAFADKIKDGPAAFLNDRNYGLLPLGCGVTNSFNVTYTNDNHNQLRVRIYQCRAITQGGIRIEILESHLRPEFIIDLAKETASSSKNEDDKLYYIVLSVDPFTKETFGDLSADEDPPRFPFTVPSCKINLLAESQLAKQGILPNSMIIGKITYNPFKSEIEEDYIPACMTINSHSKLIAFLNLTVKFFGSLELNLLSIIRKIKEKGQDSSLAQSVLSLSENLLDFLNHNFLRLRWTMKDQSPVYLFEYLATTARILRNTIEANTAANKEELLNYFTSWSELRQGDMEKLLVNCNNFEYQHHEILNSVDQFGEFMQIIAALFEKLESLAYIGKKKETNIFVKEDKPKRSFLVD